jgi:arylsulfatase A-like enzyme/tetratricopeptide (TPR) repeat protein
VNTGKQRRSRRAKADSRVLRGSVFFFAALAIGAASWFAISRMRVARVDLRPIANQNILLITIDTLRADALGCYGGAAATPAIDRLAADGVRFDFAHAHAVLTLPSHASILTGAYPFQHGIRDNSGYRLAAGARTTATLLKQAGYATGAFVAAFPLHSRFGLNQGFDVYDDRFGETRAPTEFVMPERPAHEVVALARDWIRAQQGHPWFAWVHVFEPHAPYRPPPPFDTRYARAYDGEVAAADAALAPLIDDARGGASTLVIVTGDHGEALGDHGEQTHGLFAYESTLRIPLIVAEVGSGRLKSDTPRTGEISHAAARHVDILPTILDALGQPIPGDLPGRTLLSAAARDGSPRTSYFEAMSAMLNRGWAPLSGVLVEHEKYIDLPTPERYELGRDPGEASNLAGANAERDRTLASTLRAFNAAPPGERRAEQPETAARLRALGYVTGDAPIKTKYTNADDPKALVAVDQEFHRGVDLYTSRRYDESMNAYRAIIAQRPDMAIAYRHLAFVAWETGRTRMAIDTLQRAVAAGLKSAGLVAQLGTYLAESGNAPAAISLLEPLAGGDAPDLDALNGLGIALARAGRAADAARTFERMLQVDPSNSMALVNLGALDLEANRLPLARAHFERATALDPRSSAALAGLGVVARKSGDRETAIASWRRAVELDPTNYDALYNLGTTLAESGHAEEARPYLEQFARTAPPAFYQKDIREVTALLQRR